MLTSLGYPLRELQQRNLCVFNRFIDIFVINFEQKPCYCTGTRVLIENSDVFVLISYYSLRATFDNI